MLLKFLLLVGYIALAIACPEGSVPTCTNKEMCYTWTKTTDDNPSATYVDAEIACNQKDGHLASIPNQEEDDNLAKLLAQEKYNGYYWIGLNTPGNDDSYHERFLCHITPKRNFENI